MNPIDQARQCFTTGEHVAVVAQSVREADRIGSYIALHLPHEVQSAHGAVSFKHPSGGTIVCMSARTFDLRGRTLHMAIVDDWRMLRIDAFVADITPCFASTSSRARIAALA